MDVVTSYLELGLRLGRHVEGLVDSYFGPPGIKERVDTEELVPPTILSTDAAELIESLDPGETWLRAQLVGLETVACRLAGDEIAYEDEVERCYGVRPHRVDESEFEQAHRELDDALPGPGSVAERYQAWREEDQIAGGALAGVIDSLAVELRGRTERLVGLPADESVDFHYVTDKPWAAYNFYLGGLRSRIEVNTDSGMSPAFVVELVAHETYPGHHTEHAWKEQTLVREGGHMEESIHMIGTPQSMIAEGIAGLAVEIALGDEEQEVTAKHVAGTGVGYDPDVAWAVQQAVRPLERVSGNVALMLHAEGRSREEGLEYLMRWRLMSEKRATHGLSFITDPVWRSYVTTYADGYHLCKEFVEGDPQRFKRLLTEQLTPSDLR